MGIFDALNTAVGGLQAQSYALQNISGNIANASTVGYKGIGTNFEDLLAQSSSPSTQVSGGVQALSEQTLTTAGTVSWALTRARPVYTTWVGKLLSPFIKL